MASGGNSPCMSSRRESLPEGGGPGATSIGGALKSRRGVGGAEARSVNSGIAGSFARRVAAAASGGGAAAGAFSGSASRSTSPAATGCSFSIIWLNSEYGSPTAGCAGGAGKAAGENVFDGRLSISRSRMVSRTKSWTKVPWRKRTSVFEGCTLTSTSSASHSRNSSANGYAEGGKCEQQQRHVLEPGREPLDEFQKTLVRPVQILEHHQGGLLAGEGLEEPL